MQNKKTNKSAEVTMNVNHTIFIRHEQFGEILKETFVNSTQFKLFLKAVNGCFLTSGDLTFFNSDTFFIHIPFKILKDSVITTSFDISSEIESMIKKSELEMKV
jgi:hypothetical protein